MTNKKNTDREKIKFYNRVFPFEERNDIIFFSFYVYIYLYIYIIYYTSFFLFLSFIYFYFFIFSQSVESVPDWKLLITQLLKKV